MSRLFILLFPIGAVLCFGMSCSSSPKKNDISTHETMRRNEKLLESLGAERELLEKFETKSKVSKEQTGATATGSDKARAKDAQEKKAQDSSHQKKSKRKLPSGADLQNESEESYPDELVKLSKSSRKIWAEYRPKYFVGEKIKMNVYYMGISTGSINLETREVKKLGDKDVWHLHARAKTSAYYRYLYELDDSIDSFVDQVSYSPLKYSMIQRESGQDIDDLQLFDHEQRRVFTFYKRVTDKKTSTKKNEARIPMPFTDPISVIWFLRGLDFRPGVEYDIPIVNKGELIHFKVSLVGREVIKTEIGKKAALKISGTTSYTGETLKSGDMTLWFSDDTRRVFLKFKSQIKIGSISGEIENYTP